MVTSPACSLVLITGAQQEPESLRCRYYEIVTNLNDTIDLYPAKRPTNKITVVTREVHQRVMQTAMVS